MAAAGAPENLINYISRGATLRDGALYCGDYCARGDMAFSEVALFK